jgi:uncharacterized protein YjdB
MHTFSRRRTLPTACLFFLAACGRSGGDAVTPESVASVTVTPATGDLSAIGATLQLSASARDNSGKVVTGSTVTWSSANEAVATVAATGLVTAVGKGTAQITATVEAVNGSAQVTVAQVPATMSVSPTSLDLEAGATGRLSASVADANGHAIDGQTLSWSSDDTSVATVDASGLVTAVAAGSAVVTASAGSASGTADVTVTAPEPFTPSRDTTLTGTVTVADVTIPAGVTVTLDGNVELTAQGPVTIAGTLTGDCVGVTVEGQGDVTVSGTVSTACTTPPADGNLPMVSIVSSGLLTLNGASITSGGDLRVGNTGAGAGGVAAFRGPASGGAGGGCALSGNPSLTAGPGEMLGDPEHPGQRGGNVELSCSGDTDLGGVSLKAGDGSAGDDDYGSTLAVGGTGGAGGNVTLTTDGGHVGSGELLMLTVGNGGKGGHADAQSTDPTVKARATGGAGGDAGTLTVNGSVDGSGAVNMIMGTGGNGGFAEADAAEGKDTHFDGGDAEAHGGVGGAANATIPDAFGSSILLTAGQPQGGRGGWAAAQYGMGKDGTADHRDGGASGTLTATGGAGGGVTDATGNPGKGGDLNLLLNDGGHGFDACAILGAGGDGGRGGDMYGSPGLGGFGAGGQTGAPGNVIYEKTANGGDGGNGTDPGTGGSAGGNSVLEMGNVTGASTSFQPGEDGGACQLDVNTSLTVTSDLNGHEPFIQYTSIAGIVVEVGSGGAITLRSSDSRWVELNGTLGDDAFTASGSGTVAGFSNIPVSISGALTRDADGNVTGFTGTVTIDGSTLPANASGEHNNVVYDISGTVSGG